MNTEMNTCNLGFFLCRPFILMVLAACVSFAQASKVSKDLSGLSPAATSDIIVQYVSAPTDADVQKVLGKSGKLKMKFNKISGVAYKAVSAGDLNSIASDPNVKYITPDRKVTGTMLEFAEPTINANLALQGGYDGTGVGVAVIDSGILTSSANDFKTPDGKSLRVRYSQNFVPNDNSTGDAYGHGTHVAGTEGPGCSRVNKRILFRYCSMQ